MSALSPESRSLIDAAADGDELAAGDQKRLKGAILGRVAAGAAAGTAVTVAAKAAAAPAAAGVAAGTTSGSTAVFAILGGMVLIAGVGIGINVGMSDQREAPLPPPPKAPVAVVAPQKAEPVAEEKAPEHEEATEEEAPEEEAPEKVAENEPRKVAAAPKAEAKPERTLANEAALLQRAQAEIQAGNSDAALELLEEHQSSYAKGAMTEEREAAKVFALCAAGRLDEGRAAAQRFLARYPKSPQRGRVGSACAKK